MGDQADKVWGGYSGQLVPGLAKIRREKRGLKHFKV
jgi:hypothetical protein